MPGTAKAWKRTSRDFPDSDLQRFKMNQNDSNQDFLRLPGLVRDSIFFQPVGSSSRRACRGNGFLFRLSDTKSILKQEHGEHGEQHGTLSLLLLCSYKGQERALPSVTDDMTWSSRPWQKRSFQAEVEVED